MTAEETERGDPKSHYFDAEQAAPATSREFELNGPWGSLRMRAESAVFSSHGLDKGTEVLLRHLSDLPFRRPPPGSLVCDLGCGSGPIACVAAALFPESTIEAADINSRARELTRRNARSNGLMNVDVLDDASPVPGRRYHLILSNPPIRIGKQALHDLLLSWLDRLHEDGVALIVVSKNLGADSLQRWLESQGHATEKIASSRGFRILQIRPRQAQTGGQ